MIEELGGQQKGFLSLSQDRRASQNRGSDGRLFPSTWVDGMPYETSRRDSPTSKQWVSVELAAHTGRQLFVPEYCLHGFCVTSAEPATVQYSATALYDKASEAAVHWRDKELAIRWPVEEERAILNGADNDAGDLSGVA